MNKEVVREIIKTRISTFANDLQEGVKIPDTVIEEILDNAIWAPTHGLSQTWEFRVFTEDGVTRFFTKSQQVYKEITPEERFRQEKFDKYMDKVNKVSHVIAIIVRRDPKKRFPKLEDIVSTACALQNIYI